MKSDQTRVNPGSKAQNRGAEATQHPTNGSSARNVGPIKKRSIESEAQAHASEHCPAQTRGIFTGSHLRPTTHGWAPRVKATPTTRTQVSYLCPKSHEDLMASTLSGQGSTWEERMQIEAILTQGLLKSRSEVKKAKNPSQSRNPKITVKQEKELEVVQNLQKVTNWKRSTGKAQLVTWARARKALETIASGARAITPFRAALAQPRVSWAPWKEASLWVGLPCLPATPSLLWLPLRRRTSWATWTPSLITPKPWCTGLQRAWAPSKRRRSRLPRTQIAAKRMLP